MGLPQCKRTLAEYLEWENAQRDRHEFFRGEVFAMVGARRVHGTIAGNVFADLKQKLKGSPCRAYIESMKLQVGNDSIFYPDVFVTCDPGDLRTDIIFRAPTVIVEVLSESTQAYDRGTKFAVYRQIASLREYLLIDPDTRSIELYRRGDEGLFTLYDYTGTAHFPLLSIGCELTAGEVFDGVDPIPS